MVERIGTDRDLSSLVADQISKRLLVVGVIVDDLVLIIVEDGGDDEVIAQFTAAVADFANHAIFILIDDSVDLQKLERLVGTVTALTGHYLEFKIAGVGLTNDQKLKGYLTTLRNLSDRIVGAVVTGTGQVKVIRKNPPNLVQRLGGTGVVEQNAV